jgi:hypothetical protein
MQHSIVASTESNAVAKLVSRQGIEFACVFRETIESAARNGGEILTLANKWPLRASKKPGAKIADLRNRISTVLRSGKESTPAKTRVKAID